MLASAVASSDAGICGILGTNISIDHFLILLIEEATRGVGSAIVYIVSTVDQGLAFSTDAATLDGFSALATSGGRILLPLRAFLRVDRLLGFNIEEATRGKLTANLDVRGGVEHLVLGRADAGASSDGGLTHGVTC